MKINFKKIILLIWLVLIACLAIIAVTWYKDRKFKEENTFKFKKFSYQVPANTKFKIVNEYQFEIIGKGLDAIVEIFGDTVRNVHSQAGMRSALLMENGIEVGQAQKEKIEDTEVLCFKKKNAKELLCYFDTFEPFAYEVLLKGSTNINDLKQVVHILLKAEYDYDAKELYSYYETYEKYMEIFK